jgi:sugar phosphate isomerase/epimerase
MGLTRRAFTRFALGAGCAAVLPRLATGATPSPRLLPGVSTIEGVRFGLQPFCYHDLPMNPGNRPILIERMIQNRLGIVELHAVWCEPSFAAPGVAREAAREQLRRFRVNPPAGHYEKIREEFDAAGIEVYTCWVNFGDASEAEIDAAYRAAKTLGCKGVVGSYGLAAAARLAPYSRKYGLFTGLHNHDNLSDPDALSNEASFVKGLALSPDFKATLDVRHFTAANGDCVDFLRKHHERTSSIHIGDRRHDNGRSAPFGHGDAPIIEVLQLIRDNGWPIVVLLEFEHGTLRSGVEEVQLAYDYCKRALA